MSKEISNDNICRIGKKEPITVKDISKEQTIMSKEISDNEICRLGKRKLNMTQKLGIGDAAPSQSSSYYLPSSNGIIHDPETETFKSMIDNHDKIETILINLINDIHEIRKEQRSLVEDYHRQKSLLIIIALMLIPCVAILLSMMFAAK